MKEKQSNLVTFKLDHMHVRKYLSSVNIHHIMFVILHHTLLEGGA